MPEPRDFASRDLTDDEADFLNIARPDEEETPAEEEKALRSDLRNELLRQLMMNDLFREWLMGILTVCGTFENTFANGPTGFPDPLGTWFAAGRKSVGWDLWEEIDNLTPDLASLMRREAVGKAPQGR